MSYLEFEGNRMPVEPGEGFIGSDLSNKIVVAGVGVAGRHVHVTATSDGQVSVRIVDESIPVTINGVALGPQPHPLLHGDKIRIGNAELLFAEETTSGSTQYVNVADAARLAALAAPPKSKTPGQATEATGGRLVCLTDGREYMIGSSSLRFGREAGADVVVTSKNVSRKHAEIVVTPTGYMLIDTSTNGTLVNGERVQGQRLLSRTDVIRVGDDDFRFYADIPKPPPPPVAEVPKPAAAAPPQMAPPPVAPAVSAPPPVTVAPVVAPPPPMGSAPVAPTPAPGAAHRLNDTVHGMPAAARPTNAGSSAPPDAGHRLNDTVHGIPGRGQKAATVPTPPAPPVQQMPPPAPKAPPAAPVVSPSVPPPEAPRGEGPEVLANFVIRSGSLMGQRLPIRVPIVNIGRAEYNDLVLPEDSVSTQHAKLQRREGMWFLIDLDSTNGTFVDGERVTEDVPLAPGAVVRFGEVKTFFEPVDDTVDAAKGSSTKMISAIKLPLKPSEN